MSYGEERSYLVAAMQNCLKNFFDHHTVDDLWGSEFESPNVGGGFRFLGFDNRSLFLNFFSNCILRISYDIKIFGWI